MEEMVPEADEQRLQHFLSESPWDDHAVMEQVAKGADTILGGGKADSSLILDGSAFTRTHSVWRRWRESIAAFHALDERFG